MRKRMILGAAMAFAFLLPYSAFAQNSPPTPVKVNTSDRFNIAGDYYPGSDGKPGVILSHMLNRNRSDWKSFAKVLQALGYHVLAIDLRGHGESLFNEKPVPWRKLSKNSFARVSNDVTAAAAWLRKQKGVDQNRIALVGASVGANASLVAASLKNSGIKTAVLLSPGINFRGVKTDEAIKAYGGPVLIVVSEADKYSAESSTYLAEHSKTSTLKIYKGKSHGTMILLEREDLSGIIIDWLKEKL